MREESDMDCTDNLFLLLLIDAKSWRTRCRVMAGVSLLTYVPFIVLVVIFA